ncbi:MAG: dipeptidase [Lachnospiraceae bacterium]
MKQIADLHCDTIRELYEKYKDNQRINLYRNELQVDLQKLKASNYSIQNFAIFTDYKKDGDVYAVAKEMISLYYREIEKNKEYIKAAISYDDITQCKQEGKIAAFLTLEDSMPCVRDYDRLLEFYQLGIRMITLTWNYSNEIGYAHTSSFGGLTKKGIEFLEWMEYLGIIVDVSHGSDKLFYDVLNYSKKPFVASHSNARALVNHTRNMTDDMIYQISKKGGLIGINYFEDFIYIKKNTKEKYSRIEDVIAHIKHISRIAGIDCIALGSDFDGINNNLEIKDASHTNVLYEALSCSGFTYEETEKICYKNVERLYKEVLGGKT